MFRDHVEKAFRMAGRGVIKLEEDVPSAAGAENVMKPWLDTRTYLKHHFTLTDALRLLMAETAHLRYTPVYPVAGQATPGHEIADEAPVVHVGQELLEPCRLDDNEPVQVSRAHLVPPRADGQEGEREQQSVDESL